MIRLLKIFLILASLALVIIILYVIFYQMLGQSWSNIPFTVYLYLSIAFITATFNIVYHIVSFHFCRSKEKIDFNRKIPKVLWIAGICFSSFLLYVSGASLYSFLRFIQYDFDNKQILFILAFTVAAFAGFLELSLLQKRIKRLRKEQEAKDDIETIGNLNS